MINLFCFLLQHPLPACASGEWGPAKAIRHFNIHPLTHFQSIFEIHHLPIIIKFQCPKILKFHGKLNSNQYSSIQNTNNTMPSTSTSNILDKYVKYEYNEHDFIIIFIIQLPNEGQYGLDIYARDPEYQTERRTMSHCCKYIINYSKPSIAPPPPPPSAIETTNNNHMYSFDNTKQQPTIPINNKSERSKSIEIVFFDF